MMFRKLLKSFIRPRLIAVLILLFSGELFAAELQSNWPRWRGPQDNGSTDGGTYPTKWDKDNVLWKTPLPGKGCSTPIVWNQRIYLTAPTNGRDAVLAIDEAGKQLWLTSFGEENPGKHRNGSGCNPSPTTDGDGLFVNFKSGTLAALELDGSIRWQTDVVERYGRDTLYWDHGASPVLTADCVVLVRMHKGESWVAAFDKNSGELRWNVARNFETPTEGDHGYTTPLIIKHRGREALLVWGGQHVTVHDATNGKVLWSCAGFNPDAKPMWPAIASPVIAGDVAVIPFGRNDKGEPRLHGIRLGDITGSRRIWMRNDIGTFVPTPAAYNKRVYMVRDRGQVECIDPSTGKTIWSDAFPKNRASFYSSPLVVGENIYAAREDGVVFVAAVEDGFEFLSANEMGEPVIASPVPMANRLLIRGEDHLFCVK